MSPSPRAAWSRQPQTHEAEWWGGGGRAGRWRKGTRLIGTVSVLKDKKILRIGHTTVWTYLTPLACTLSNN